MGFDMQYVISDKIDIPSRPQKMTLAPALTRKQNGNVKRLGFKNPDTLRALDIF